MIWSTLTRLRVAITILVIHATVTAGQVLFAAPPGSAAERILRIDVPADRPSEWSRDVSQLIAVPREEFEQLLKRAEAKHHAPPEVQIATAHYTATLAGQALRDGRATLSLQRVGMKPALLSMGLFNIAIQSLDWSKRSAVWGNDETGQTWLLADSVGDNIHMTWSAAGRNLPDEMDFDLQFPAAAISVFDLKAPRNQSVSSTPRALRIDEGSDEQYQVWRIQLASDRRCRVTISPAKDVSPRKPTILFEHELGAVVREEDLRFQTVFHLEVFDAPVSELVFTIPASVEIYAVTYGADTPLTWTRSNKNEPAGTLTVRLPDGLQGRSRPLRIDGVAVQKPNAPMISPQIAVKGGIFLAGRQTLTIIAPLQLRSFRLAGFRQQTPATPSAEGESYSFVQLLPEAQLVLDVGRPQGSLTAQVQSLFETSETAWTLTSEITWTASSGGVFQTECQFPPEWEITDVRPITEQGTTRLAGWDLQTQVGGGALLTIEFLEALVPTVPRTVRVLARRRAYPTGSSFAMPVPQPVNCYTVETTLGLLIPSNFTPFFSDDSRVERITPPVEILMTSIRAKRPTTGQNEFWFRRDGTEAGGSLQLVSRLRRLVASSETLIDATPTGYFEQYHVRCNVEGTPLDRLLVYLTQPGADVRWTVQTPRQGDLTAQRLPVAQHADWNCPNQGELWELRLPPLPTGPIEIEGRRDNRWSPPSQPALLVVPQAIDRHSRVVLRSPSSFELLVESERLDAAPVPPDAQEPSNLDSQSPATTVSSEWHFDRADARLTLTPRSSERSKDFPTMVSLRLRSLISANSQGFDLYRAQFQLENGVARDELRIQLPSPAVLQQVTVAGQIAVPSIQNGMLLLSDVNAADRDVVELLYRVPSRGGHLRDVHHIVVPQVSATVLGFSWEFALPPSVTLHSEPRGVRLTRPVDVPRWTARIFGPLGRPSGESIFNPLALESWKGLVQPKDSAASSVGELSRDLIAPAEWQIHEAVSSVAPTEIHLETWDSTQTRLLSWISLLLSLTIGLTVRINSWKFRDRMAAYWLAMLVAIALCGPPPYAGIAGGAIAGTMIALLTPRRSLVTPPREKSQVVPLGSTRSFHWGASAGLLLIVSCLIARGLAQDPTAPAPAAPETRSDSSRARSTILVPVDADGKPSKALPLVYAPQQLITDLKQTALVKTAPPRFLISSAHYQIAATHNASDSLLARFRIHILDASTEQAITFPISEAVLAGADACRINGQAHPVAIAPDGRGFVVTWSPTIPSPGESTNETGTTGAPISLEIELDLKQVKDQTELGGVFLMAVPPVAATRWSVSLSDPVAYFDVSGARGATTPGEDRRKFDVDYGLADKINVRWSQNPPETRPVRLEASLLQFLELRATVAELRFRVQCEPLEGTFDFLEFDLPPNCLIREGDIRAANLLRAEVIPGTQGPPKLRVVFTESQRQAVTVDGTLLIAGPDIVGSLPLPQFGLARNANVRISAIRNWWCLSVSPEFRLTHQDLDSELLGSISPSEFLHTWGESPPTGRPQLVFQPRDGSVPSFSVSPQQPRRRALTWTQTGHVGKRRLEWTVVSKLETSQAPVYQHTLLVDRRLQIEAVSVVENGAERLVRWSETRHSASPTRVVLFLSDKTTGVQQLSLRASMPMRYGRTIPLPFIRCEEVELVESRWELFRDADVEVELTLPRGVPRQESIEEAGLPDGPQLIARYQTADPDTKTSMRMSARQAHCTARTAAVLSHNDGTTWKLTAQVKLLPQSESPRRIGVKFPASSIDPARVRVEHAEPTWHEPSDGQRRLDLTLPPEPGEVTLSFDTLLEAPAKGEWSLPFPEPQEATSHELNLVVAPADTWTPLVGTELKPEESPPWAADFFKTERPETTAPEYRLDGTLVRLRRSPTPIQVDQPMIRLLEHSIWLSPEGAQHGFSRAYLSQVRGAVELQTPRAFRLIALFLDDRPLALPTVVEDRVHIPLLGGAREAILVLVWERSEPQIASLLQNAREELPWPTGIEVVRSLVSVVPHGDAWVVTRGIREGRDWLDSALDRLEMLLDRQESLGNDPRAAAANFELIHELQSQVTDHLAAIGTTRPSSVLTERLERWKRIVEILNQFEPPQLPQEMSSNVRLPELDEPFLELPRTLRPAISPSDHSVDFWVIDRRWIMTICTLALGLLALPLLRRLIRLDWGEWLNIHTTVAWILLGIVWWSCLTPGALGPVIIFVAAIRAMLQRRQTESSVVIQE